MFFFFHGPATPDISTFSLHDALPISRRPGERPRDHPAHRVLAHQHVARDAARPVQLRQRQDRKSTRLNSSHVATSYAVFCLKKKKHTTVSNFPSPYLR